MAHCQKPLLIIGYSIHNNCACLDEWYRRCDMAQQAPGDQWPVYNNSQDLWTMVLGPYIVFLSTILCWYVLSSSETISTSTLVPSAVHCFTYLRRRTSDLECGVYFQFIAHLQDRFIAFGIYNIRAGNCLGALPFPTSGYHTHGT